MTFSKEEITLAYTLFLGRSPSAIELERMQSRQRTIEGLRRTFLLSEEFATRFASINPHRDTADRQPHNASSPPLLVHLHVPKTAGTSLTQILASNLQDGETLALDAGQREILAELPEPIRNRLRLVFGHLWYGIGRELGRRTVYICAIRRARPRLLSYFNYIKRRSDHPMHAFLTERSMEFGDFLEFCADEQNQRIEVDNSQIRRIAGSFSYADIGNEAALLRDAIGNAFSPSMVVGLTEQFDELLETLVAQELIKTYQPTRENAAPQAASIEEAETKLTSRQLEILEAFTHWDDTFYDLCEQFLLPARSGERQRMTTP